MSNISIEVDASRVLKMFEQMEYKHQKQTYRTALRKASSILVKQTRSNLRAIIGRSISKKSAKTGKSMSSGVRVSVDREATQATVHIMGDYRLKWFEKGTVPRQTKKGYSRGQMKPTYFFRQAQDQTEDQIFDEMGTTILESILKVQSKIK